MYSDTDSDNEYTSSGSWHVRSRELTLRVLDKFIFGAKDAAYFLRSRQAKSLDEEQGRLYWSKTDKECMREMRDDLDRTLSQGWRRFRAQRVFKEVEGFHKGNLDLTGRSPERYIRIMRRFTPFLESFRALAPHVQYEEVERITWDDDSPDVYMKPVAVPVIPPNLWSQFCARWKITPHFDYEDTLNGYTAMLKVLQERPTPKFQELFLLDLPPEILAVVFEYAGIDDGRALATTCKYMREIGLTHIFASRCILMKEPRSVLQELVTSSRKTNITIEEVNSRVRELMTAGRDGCIQDARFLGSRSDICARVQSLTMGNSWAGATHDRTAVGEAIIRPSDSTFFGPLLEQFAELLRHLRLKTLEISYLTLDVALFTEIARQPLSLLRTHRCSANEDLQVALANGGFRSTLPCLRLRIVPPNDEAGDRDIDEFTIWSLLGACPQLRLLHVDNCMENDRLRMPDQIIWHSFTCLNSVERVHIDSIPWQITDFTEMFEHAASRGPLRVTHLKLSSAWGIPEDDILHLLRVLHGGGSPLEVLALDGIYPLTMALFDGIANMFPSLHALTLVRRDSIRQNAAKFCPWGRPLYEYAARLRRLTELRHFAANFAVDIEEMSPYVFRYLEPDFDPANAWDLPIDADYMSDALRSVTLPFAATCPKLESFFLVTSSPVHECRIRRLDGGGFELDERQGYLPEAPEWNPGYGRTFPPPPPAS
ncbi:hypothetical protein EXIGLDRAFT_830837 [Exidia glandulosa HHB12029]|uniref:F-box domain-containing protein n=1 Tax=Exidia glandulosa HHB12029 TaxID=1314781 RepID=A0A165NA67_EXIGL|nr:hypothetical protein EXIGLDRAFT_830837 [Exidia glandulosa HHB12029]